MDVNKNRQITECLVWYANVVSICKLIYTIHVHRPDNKITGHQANVYLRFER